MEATWCSLYPSASNARIKPFFSSNKVKYANYRCGHHYLLAIGPAWMTKNMKKVLKIKVLSEEKKGLILALLADGYSEHQVASILKI